MSIDITVPEIGESISSGILAAWLKANGDTVSEGEEIFELETDKATLAVPSPVTGTLTVSVSEGTEVSVGQVVGTIAQGTQSGKDAEPQLEGETAEPTLSPAVRRIVAEHDLNPSSIVGTGPGGRITKADALRAAEAGKGSSGSAASPTDRATPPAPEESPAEQQAPAGPERGAEKPVQRRVPLSNLRLRIAENLVASRQNSAHVTTFNEVDMSSIIEIRAKYRDAFEKRYGVRLGFMSFFVKASQYALEQVPEVNAFLDGSELVYNETVDIGVALSSEKGLLTPVIRNVAELGFGDVESRIVDFIARANAKRLKPDEMMGATFTISNGGVFGSLLSTPIPSPPQTAVLGMHAMEKRPVVVNDEIVIRPMMYLALTYDHRVIDGREAVGFLARIKQIVEDPTQLLLGL